MPAALLRDPAMISRSRAGLPYAWVEAEVAHQLLRLLEASRVADRRHDGEPYDHVDSRDCHQAFNALVPQRGTRKIALDDLEVLAEPIELAQMTFDGKPFVLRQDLMEQPCPSARPAQIGVRAGGERARALSPLSKDGLPAPSCSRCPASQMGSA